MVFAREAQPRAVAPQETAHANTDRPVVRSFTRTHTFTSSARTYVEQ